MVAVFDFSHKNDVVTFLVAATVEAFKASHGTAQQGRALNALGEIDSCKTIRTLCGKALGQFLLVSAQNVDGVMRSRAECCKRAGSL